MKIQLETALFQVPFGSHLYGTNTPTSDYDYKVVCLPSFEDLLMNKKLTNRVVKPEGWKEGDKMGKDEVEKEFIPLQCFLDQFFEGQTYALEMAFAVLSDMHVTLERNYGELAATAAESILIQEWMQELVEKFLTREVRKMIGYAVSQSQQYGLKTERYNSLLKARELIDAAERHTQGDWKGKGRLGSIAFNKLQDNMDLVNKLCELDYIEHDTIMNANGGTTSAPAINLGGKQYPLTTTWKTVWLAIDTKLKGYGNRVKDHTDQPTDWKALSHAIRIGEQIIELLETGRIQFPRPGADYLLSVKRGEIPLEQATNYLTHLFNKIDGAIEKSTLQEKTPELEEEFYEWKLSLLRRYYMLES